MVLARVIERRAGLVLALVAALAGFGACSPERSGDELFAPGGEDIAVVNAMLVVGKTFPVVYLSVTLRPDEPFSWARAGIPAASVTIEGGGVSVTYGEFAPVAHPGIYEALDSAVVTANTTYRLRATLPDGRVLRATTTTPAPVEVRSWVLLNDEGTAIVQELSTFAEHGDTVYQQPENQLVYPRGLLEARLQPAAAAGYQIGLQSLDLGSQLLVDAEFLDEEDLDIFTRVNESPPVEPSDTDLRVPWFAMYYEGRYVMRVFAMDLNWFDLARTDPVLGGGGFGFGGATGDSTEPPIFHVEGGIGLFGSMSSDSVGFYIHPP
jgi:hypothetical protein